jgi:polyisoprenoid-binding protein YceI
MKKSLLALAFSTAASVVFAADYQVASTSTLGFSTDFQGESFDGSFKKFDATIRYDAENLADSKFDVKIDLASVETGDDDRDGALPDSDFFHIAKFPQAQFVTTGFRHSGSDVIADGTLSLKGISKPVSLTVKFTDKGDTATLDVATSIKRLDFNVGEGQYADTSTIGDEVKIKAHLDLKKQ